MGSVRGFGSGRDVNTCNGCEPGKYGDNCSNNCTCSNKSLESCEKDTGKCTCVPGKQGDDCQTDCNEGWYGINCSYPCNCTSSQTCNPVSGDCTCKPGRQGQACEQVCSNGKYGEDCKSLCNCSSVDLCDPVSGMCISDSICNQLGTSNCDNQRNAYNCSDELKGAACIAANRTTVEHIQSFMTTICNCQIEDVFCVPTNESCYCKNGWTGDLCEILASTCLVLSKKSLTIREIIGGVAGGVVIVILVVPVIYFKRRQSTNAAKTTVDQNKNDGVNKIIIEHTEHDVAKKPSDNEGDASGLHYENARGEQVNQCTRKSKSASSNIFDTQDK